MKRKTIALLCALALTATTSLSLLGCGGCAGNKPQGAQASGQSAVEEKSAPMLKEPACLQDVPVRPLEAELSPEARNTYAYLLYAQALLDEDEAALLQAASMLRFRPRSGWRAASG